MSVINLSADDKNNLLKVARQSVEYFLKFGDQFNAELDNYSSNLQQPAASFVTLYQQQKLRGCIGHLQAINPLVIDVSKNAYSAAFQDPRFPSVANEELKQIQFSISVLSEPIAISVSDETELLSRLKPGVDGLTLKEGVHHATFLPSVWESLVEPREFLSQLKVKAGFPPTYWSEGMSFEVYQTDSFSEM
ncbi:AmmeMemoRadiSam system protein A [Pleionea sediminis]|uniref:AmmeMemoRadiSam system protein A n=1 Tax=Pleionea sediminis TaxID=2569479 RepID=UPI0013DE65B7|nr:AmmeMemoRadiSam system protein A [Pleionea sediminis]